jgi:hypothetical protein
LPWEHLIGLIAALAVSRVLSSLLFSIGPHDPITFVLVTLVLDLCRDSGDFDSSLVGRQG